MSENTSSVRTSIKTRIAILLITIVLIVLMFPRGGSIESQVNVGSVWMHDDLIATSAFEILKDPAEYELEKKQAARKIQPIFLKDNNIQKVFADSLLKYDQSFSNILNQKTAKQQNQTFLSDPSYSVFVRFKNQPKTFFGAKTRSLKEIFDVAHSLLEEIYQKGLLNQTFKEISRDSIAVREGKFEKVYPKNNFFDRNSANDYVFSSFKSMLGNNGELNEAVDEYLSHFLKPNLLYSNSQTEIAIHNAEENVPRNVGIVNANEKNCFPA